MVMWVCACGPVISAPRGVHCRGGRRVGLLHKDTTQKTSASRELTAVTTMYDVKEGQSDLHFGNNVYLAAGMYTITVAAGNEQTIFKDIAVGNAQ